MTMLFIETPIRNYIHVKERMNMAETLSDAIGSFIEKNDEIYNEYVNVKLARMAAQVVMKLRSAQVRFADKKAKGDLNDTLRTTLLVDIMELKEEAEDIRRRMMTQALLQLDNDERRCIFRLVPERKAALLLIDFVRIFNKWTEASADYLILKARRDYELDKLNTDSIDIQGGVDSDKLSQLRERLIEEYKKKVADQETQLKTYCDDLQRMADVLDSSYMILDKLEELIEDASILDS